MRRRSAPSSSGLVLVVLAVIFAAPPSPASPQWTTWDRYMDTGQRALEHGREASAEYWFSNGVTIPDTAAREKGFVVGGQTIEVTLVTLGSIQVGEATIENLQVAVGDAMPGHPDIDGLLGADFLQRFRLTGDKQTRRLTLEPVQR